jgi:hypothetical protein
MDRLHKIGVRSTVEIEEVIEGYSFADEQYFEELENWVIRIIGFSQQLRALKIACVVNAKLGVIKTLDVKIPTINEVINDFCRFAVN